MQSPFCNGAELPQRSSSFSTARPIDMLGSRPFGDDSRRECDGSVPDDEVWPSLLAFLENVASMSDCSTTHDLAKVSPSRIYYDFSL